MNADFVPNDEYWMQLAYEQAALAAAQDEIPVGAVIVSHGKAIGMGFNAPIKFSDPTAHAEIQALRSACQSLNNYRLPEDATLYVTLEPCSMCAGLIVHARIARVVFGASEPKAGVVHSRGEFFAQGFLNHRVLVEGGVLADECSAALSAFFKARRLQG